MDGHAFKDLPTVLSDGFASIVRGAFSGRPLEKQVSQRLRIGTFWIPLPITSSKRLKIGLLIDSISSICEFYNKKCFFSQAKSFCWGAPSVPGCRLSSASVPEVSPLLRHISKVGILLSLRGLAL